MNKKQLDILIVNPLIHSQREKQFDMPVRPRPPLDLAYLQALLKKEYSSELVDARAKKMLAPEVIADILEKKPKIVIVTTTPLDRWECPNLFIDSIFDIVNEVSKVTQTIICGSHGTVTPHWIFENCKADYVVRGEPENPVTELVKAIMAGRKVNRVKGISYLSGKKVVDNPDAKPVMDLDSLPFPAYEDLDIGAYRYTSDDIPCPFTIMLASRGCPFSCTFCLKKMMAAPYRVRQPEKAVEEMLLLQERFGIKGYIFLGNSQYLAPN